MAVLVRPTPNGIVVTGVYTPPEHRRRGYASCCVDAISRRALESGKCFALDERLGYRFVCASEHWNL